MGEIEMPFPCKSKGCKMTFTNEDHLNVHKKKHEMVLNLGLISKTMYADKTPTPTRFIRNCEEVGLFQDLQNVNPFEETFKKAIELSKSGTLYMPEPITDDTLHTPHILPHIIQETQINNLNMPDVDESDFNISDDVLEIDLTSPCSSIEEDVQIIDTEICEKLKKIDELVLSPETVRNNTLNKLRNTINKNKSENQLKNRFKVNFNQFQIRNKINISMQQKVIKNLKPKINMYDKNLSDIDKKREINRAAQFRSRQKKKKINEEVETQLITLRQEKEQLKLENQFLKNELCKIQSILQKHVKCVYMEEPDKNNYINHVFVPNINNSLSVCRPIQPKIILQPINGKVINNGCIPSKSNVS